MGLFQRHVHSRTKKLLDHCIDADLIYEPYGEDQKAMSPSEVNDAKNTGGIFQEPLGLRKDYQDRIRVAYYRSRGQSDQSIAERLGLQVAFVQSCKGPEMLSAPRQIPKYIADHGLRCLQGGIEPFRPAELRRRFLNATPAVHRALSASLNWVAAPALKRD